MMYEYATLEDGTAIASSNINKYHTVRVEIERPRDWGFDSASCLMPVYSWLNVDGFSAEDLDGIQQFLQRNAPLIFRLAQEKEINYA